ncbi:MAG: siroheme synthase CysG [Pseudomonadota bacterium]
MEWRTALLQNTAMPYLPLFLDSTDRNALLVGGGVVATRKAELLLRAGMRLSVIAPTIQAALEANPNVCCQHRRFAPDDLDGADLVFAATDDPALNREIVALCQVRGVLCNAATDSQGGDFILPSVIDRDPIQVAISTSGASPLLARLIRSRLETLLPMSYARLAALLERFRGQVKRRVPAKQRRRFWQEILEGPVADLVHSGHDDEAETVLGRLLDNPEEVDSDGEVYIVGAGPGDPDLLTVRALRLLQQADVVVWDRLVSPPIRALIPTSAEAIYAGKRRSEHQIPQDDLNLLLVELARSGKRVCRLKGGDPFVFGRGGEEIETLVAHGVRFQVVPGITAANGCAAYAGIPLTHRDHAQSVSFHTGNLKAGELVLDWSRMSDPQQTLVFYMGTASLPIIQRELVAHGRSADTPAALIQQGTTPHQRVAVGTLDSLHQVATDAGFEPPCLIVVGDVVKLYATLRWYRTGADAVDASTGWFDTAATSAARHAD